MVCLNVTYVYILQHLHHPLFHHILSHVTCRRSAFINLFPHLILYLPFVTCRLSTFCTTTFSFMMEADEWDSILHFVRPPLSRSMSATQIPTPPVRDPLLWIRRIFPSLSQISVHGAPSEESEQTTISVSTTFFPGAELDMLPTDLIMLSSDSVFFYVHTHKILAASANGFNSLLPLKEHGQPDDVGGILPLRHHSVVVNILLHTIYDMSATHYAPTPEAVVAAVDCFEEYGLSVRTHLAPPSPFYALFLGTAPQAPIEFYAISGAYDLHHLAVPISSFLLTYPLATLTDELAVKMGPLYLKRLFYLHLGRVEALKRLLLPPPQSHPPTANCDIVEQKKLTRAWALASAYLAWDVRPDLSTHAIEAALRPLGDYLACDQCTQLLRERINNLVSQWSTVKRTV
ncbi:hypothetical protein F5148DRAFT_867610 [Russula earlei]|uniref:Uncharacterized protein n=1 Tax=Russula earlei TaxID=71964 RepID=A0ACC0UBG2_9AGAM|nr:hypothetical protein F5148DRAFT_867610 [Russula earlei]